MGNGRGCFNLENFYQKLVIKRFLVEVTEPQQFIDLVAFLKME